MSGPPITYAQFSDWARLGKMLTLSLCWALLT